MAGWLWGDDVSGTGTGEVTSGFLTTREGVKLATDIAGEPFNQRIIFVHGGQSRQAWRATLGMMAASGYSVLSYDLRGHGQSDWAQNGDYSLNAHIRDLTAIVNASARPPVLIGAFLGGRVALGGAAMLGAGRVAAVVLIESAPRMSGLSRIRRFVTEALDGYDTPDAARQAVKVHFSHPIEIAEEDTDMPIEQGEGGRYFWKWDPALARLVNRDQSAIERRLSQASGEIDCPLLIVRSTDSDMVTDDSLSDLVDRNPDVVIAEVDTDRVRSYAGVRSEYWSSVLGFLAPIFSNGADDRKGAR